MAFGSALPWIMALLWCVTNERIHAEVPKSTACFAAKICGQTVLEEKVDYVPVLYLGKLKLRKFTYSAHRDG